MAYPPSTHPVTTKTPIIANTFHLIKSTGQALLKLAAVVGSANPLSLIGLIATIHKGKSNKQK
jgi:hypothetical protein